MMVDARESVCCYRIPHFDEIPHGWKPIKGASTAPVGYEWISNGKSRFSKDYKIALAKERKSEKINFSQPISLVNPIKQGAGKENEAKIKSAGFQFSDEQEISEKLNRLAREEMKLYLLKDIVRDITVCKLEGWAYKEYLRELQQIIEGFLD